MNASTYFSRINTRKICHSYLSGNLETTKEKPVKEEDKFTYCYSCGNEISLDSGGWGDKQFCEGCM